MRSRVRQRCRFSSEMLTQRINIKESKQETQIPQKYRMAFFLFIKINFILESFYI